MVMMIVLCLVLMMMMVHIIAENPARREGFQICCGEFSRRSDFSGLSHGIESVANLDQWPYNPHHDSDNIKDDGKNGDDYAAHDDPGDVDYGDDYDGDDGDNGGSWSWVVQEAQRCPGWLQN